MARSGPKRKDVPREPNGQIQRPTSSVALNAKNKADALAQQSVVLAQPHRLGSDHKWRGCALGRFLLDNGINDTHLFSGVEAYVSLKRNWAIAQGAPRGFANPTAGPGGDGPSEETVRGWLAQYVAIDRKLVRLHGSAVFNAIALLGYADRDLDSSAEMRPAALLGARRIIDGMLTIAIEMGTKSARLTPFL